MTKSSKSDIGHNSGDSEPTRETVGGIAGEALQQHVDRIERLSEEMKALSADIKQVYAEAKATGFDVKILRKVITLRKIAEHDRKEQDEILDLYMRALGMD